MRLVQANFLGKELIPTHRLHQLWSDRNSIATSSNGRNRYSDRVDLITETLKFGLDSISNIVDGSHFEFCVFVDAEMPFLLAYFDSNRNSTARSMKDRRQNPNFYRDSGYEVTKLLLKPSTYPLILEDTSDPAAEYVFATENQKKQLLSSILVCIDTHRPCAIVVSSNKKRAFNKNDERAISFIKLLAEMIKYDLFSDDFIGDVRKNNIELFPDGTNTAALQPAI